MPSCISETRAEHFRFGSVLDQNKQSNRFYFIFFVFEPNRTENQLISFRFGSVQFSPFQTGSNRNY